MRLPMSMRLVEQNQMLIEEEDAGMEDANTRWQL